MKLGREADEMKNTCALHKWVEEGRKYKNEFGIKYDPDTIQAIKGAEDGIRKFMADEREKIVLEERSKYKEFDLHSKLMEWYIFGNGPSADIGFINWVKRHVPEKLFTLEQ